MDQLFTRDDAWAGGFYEAAFALTDASKAIVNRTLAQLWAHPSLEGCFLRRDLEPFVQQKLSPLDTEHEGHWYGVATLPNERRCACGSYSMDLTDEGCWVCFYLPLGSLGMTYPTGSYPFAPNSVTRPSPELWITEINTWLKGIAVGVYARVKFKVAIIGFEVELGGVLAHLGDEVPIERWDGILLPRDGQLVWFGPTIFQPPFTVG